MRLIYNSIACLACTLFLSTFSNDNTGPKPFNDDSSCMSR